jgi:hypothetical protein
VCDFYGIKKQLRYSSNLIIRDNRTSYLFVGDNYFIIIVYLTNENRWRLIIRNEFKVFFDIKTKPDYTVYVNNDTTTLNFYIENVITKREDDLIDYIKNENIVVSRYFNFIDKIKKVYIVSI